MSALQLKDFLEMTNGQLEAFLKRRGLSCAGNHDTLASRALNAHEKSIPVKNLPDNYPTILKSHNIEDPFKDENFADDHELLPPTNIGHVFSYILLKKAFEAEYIGQYKARKAYSFYKSGFVDKLYLLKGSNDRTIIKSKCIPSQRINEKKHELWFIINSGSGEVVSSYCTCTAGLAESCNHVIAALYKLEFA